MRLLCLPLGCTAGSLIFLLALPAPAAEPGERVDDWEDVDIEELLDVVISATKKEQRVDEAPSIVSVITATDIRRRGYRTVGEALRSLAGLHVIDDHTYTNVGVRGLFAAPGSATDIIKVMINGQPVSFRPIAGNFFGHELLPVEAVKRIEVIRGPGSALYGANAFLGVVNIVTFDGTDLEQGERHAVATQGVYTQNEHRHGLNGTISVLSGEQAGPFSYLVAATYHYADRSGLPVPGLDDIGRDIFHRTNPALYAAADGHPSPGWDPPTRERLLRTSPSANDLERTGSAYARAALDLGEAGRLSLDGNFQYFDRFGEFQDFSYLTHENRITYLNWFTRMRYQLAPACETGLSLNASVAVAGGSPTGDDHIVDPLTPGTYMRRRFGYLAADAVLEASWAFSADNIVTLGVDYTNDAEDLLTMEVFNRSTGESYMEEGFGERTFANLGLYAQWLWSPVEGLGLTLGSRLDHNDAIACSLDEWDCFLARGDASDEKGTFQLSNRAAVVYAFPFWDMYAKAIYGSSFKPPSPFQLYHRRINIAGSVGNPDLKPQTADTFEFMLGTKPVDGLHLAANLYATTVTDMVVFFQEGGVVEGRNADVTLLGLEGELSYTHQEFLSTYLHAGVLLQAELAPKQRADEADATWNLSPFNAQVPVGMYPGWMVHLGLNLHFPASHINANLEVSIIGERDASMLNNQLYNSLSLKRTYTLDAYAVVNLTLSSVGLKFWGERETVLSASLRHVPGGFVEPGYGGVDIPGPGPEILFRIEQRF